MKKIGGLLVLVFTLFSCQNQGIELFNGKNLSGWYNYGGGKFYVEDDCIVGEAVTGTPNTFLHTDKKYQNFVLEFDVKLDTLLNSGVQVRSNIYPEDVSTVRWGGRFDDGGQKIIKNIDRKAGVFWGYQIEIDPSSRAWSGMIYEEAGRGFLQTPGLDPKVMAAFKPLEWNHFKISVDGNHIQSWVNGVKAGDVLDEVTSNGYIALQLHGIGKNKMKEHQKIRWKNIRLRPL